MRLFGRFAVTVGDEEPITVTGKKNQALLAYLAANADRAQPRERLAGLLWGDRFDEQARQSLRQAISKLRKDLGDSGEKLLLIDGDDIALNNDAISVDVQKFEKLAATESAEALEQAAALYGGAFLDGFSIKEEVFDDWISGQRARYADLAADVLSKHCLQQETIGKIGEAIATGKKLVRLDPLREQAHRDLMRLFACYGQRSQALKQYKLCADILRKELDAEPEARTKQVYEEIRGSEAFLPTTSQDTLQPNVDPQANASVHQPDTPFPLPDKPSIAVLPFNNLSGDPDQEYFADGMTEDIITALSKFRWLFVIARNSSFTYKGQAVDIRTVAKELGVRYVLEGSVRKAGDQIRVTSQLVDGSTGSHIWSNRYDRKLDDIFAVQDEITETIAGAIEPALGKAEWSRSRTKRPENFDAWDLHLQGLQYLHRRTEVDLAEAVRLFDSALALDPTLVPTLSAKEEAIFFQIVDGVGKSIGSLRAEAIQLGLAAVQLDAEDPAAHYALGRAYIVARKHELAIPPLRTAIELNPSYAWANYALGMALATNGQPAEAIPHLEAALRLSPYDPYLTQFLTHIGTAHLFLRDHEQAVSWARKALEKPKYRWSTSTVLISALGHLGRIEEAGAAIMELKANKPEVNLEFAAAVWPIADKKSLDHLVDGLRKSGFE